MKLYKFRSLGDDRSAEWTEQIVESGGFRCSQFWEMNDPMEGVYRTDRTVATDAMLNEMFSEKARFRICSFSGEDAMKRPVMWGYYANGFKGVALEIDIPRANVEEVIYLNRLQAVTPSDPPPLRARDILCTKLKPWKHEQEFRFLDETGQEFVKIGTITGVYLGLPFRNAENYDNVETRYRHLREYHTRARRLLEIARRKSIPAYEARVTGRGVRLTTIDVASTWIAP